MLKCEDHIICQVYHYFLDLSLYLSFFRLIPMNVPPLFDPSGGVEGTFKQFKLQPREEIKANIFEQIGSKADFFTRRGNSYCPIQI